MYSHQQVVNQTVNNYHMIREIRQQPEVFSKILNETRVRVREIAQEVWKSGPPERQYVIGCGSSYYAAMIGGFYHEHVLGLDTRVLPSSEFFWYAPLSQSRSAMLISLSRSGRTSESVEATRKAMKLKVPAIAVTCDPRSTMGQEANYCLDISMASEESTIMTKSFTASALCSVLFGLELATLQKTTIPPSLEDKLVQLPKNADEVIQTVEGQTRTVAEKMSNASRFVYLGSGGNYAACLEGALKLRETSYFGSEAYHTLEFRHGPFAQLEKGIDVLVVVPNSKSVPQEATLLKEITSTGATVIPISNVREIADAYPDSVRMPESIPSEFAPLLFMIPMQMLAYYHALKRGLNPDRPRNLSKYITTEIS